MGVFITTTNSLTPHVTNEGSQVSEQELSRHITNIMKEHEKLNENNDMSMVNDHNVDNDFQIPLIKVLESTLKTAEDYNPAAQYTILQTITNVVINEGEQSDKYRSFYKEVGWDLLEWIEPFMYTANGEESINSKVRRSATLLFRHIAQQVSEKEVMMLAMEKMSMVDWDDIVLDEEKSIREAIKMVEYFEIFGEALERLKSSTMILDRIIYPTHYCSKAIQFLETILYERSSWGDNERPMSQWDQIMFVVLSSLLDFVEYCKCTSMVNNNKHPLFNEKLESKPESSDLGQDSDEVKLWYLGVYLLNLIFDKLILNMDMDLTTIYSHLYQWKYNIKRPFQNKSKTIEMYTPGRKTEMLDLVFRCARIAKSLGITFDGLLRLRRFLGEPKHDGSEEEQEKNEKEKVNSNMFTLSYSGITSLLAISIYDAYIVGPAFDMSHLGLLPLVIYPQWIGREMLGPILRLITEPQRANRVDKGLFLLFYLAKHVNVKIDQQMLVEYQLPGPLITLQKFDLLQGLEIISSTAAMCPNADLRYAAYQMIRCFIDMCTAEAQLFVFLKLLESCPFQPMRAATVNLLKDRIANAFENDNDPNFFNSHVIADKLFPLLFQKPSPSKVWETYGYEMQVLNLYLYLLMRDKSKNQSGVWDDNIIDSVKITYLEPLKKAIEILHKEDSANDDETRQSHAMQLSLLSNTLDQVNELLDKKNN